MGLPSSCCFSSCIPRSTWTPVSLTAPRHFRCVRIGFRPVDAVAAYFFLSAFTRLYQAWGFAVPLRSTRCAVYASTDLFGSDVPSSSSAATLARVGWLDLDP